MTYDTKDASFWRDQLAAENGEDAHSKGGRLTML